MNPYKDMPNYGPDYMEKYSSKPRRGNVEPHIFNVAEDTFRSLVRTSKCQSIVVCGESGAGKSESAKLLMKHLAYTTSKSTTKAEMGKTRRLSIGKKRRSSMTNTHVIEFPRANEKQEEKVLSILAMNPILEAFGNAKTVLNHNSSRFGKFIKLQFEKSPNNQLFIKGSAIETFVLETSRVVFQSKGERNYHIFYQLINGLDSKRRELWSITKAADYRYCNQSECYSIPDARPDSTCFNDLVNAMSRACFTTEDIYMVFQVISAVLHLGNVDFYLDGKEVCHIAKASSDSLELASRLLGISIEVLTSLLTRRHFTIAGKEICKSYNEQEACVNRDSTAKSVYKGVFDWIVTHINKSFSGTKHSLHIGILDIFGFEIFEDNSFEQLCINLTNERLQAFFNTTIVLAEQAEYITEAILWSPVTLPDNKGCLSGLMDRKRGLFAILDSICRTPNADHINFTNDLFGSVGIGPKNQWIIKANTGGKKRKGQQKKYINGILVKHYSKDVVYNAKDFLRKNMERISDDLFKTLTASSIPLCNDVAFSTPALDKAKSKKARKRFTVGAKFLLQLKDLLAQLGNTQPRFVRCLKPNLKKKPKLWTPSLVTSQLESGGLIQAIKIIKLGYPTRVEISQVYDLYKGCLSTTPEGLNPRDFCESVLSVLGISAHKMELGLTKVFFKESMQDLVSSILNPSEDAMSDPKMGDKIQRHLIHKKVIRTMAVVKAYCRFRSMFFARHAAAAAFAIQAVTRAFLAKASLRDVKSRRKRAYEEGLKRLQSIPESGTLELLGTHFAAWAKGLGEEKIPGGFQFYSCLATGVLLTKILIQAGVSVPAPRTPSTPGSSAAYINSEVLVDTLSMLPLGSQGDVTREDLFEMKQAKRVANALARLSVITTLPRLPILRFQADETGRDPLKVYLFAVDGDAHPGFLDKPTANHISELKEPGSVTRRRREEAERKRREEEEKERRQREEAEGAKKTKANTRLASSSTLSPTSTSKPDGTPYPSDSSAGPDTTENTIQTPNATHVPPVPQWNRSQADDILSKKGSVIEKTSGLSHPKDNVKILAENKAQGASETLSILNGTLESRDINARVVDIIPSKENKSVFSFKLHVMSKLNADIREWDVIRKMWVFRCLGDLITNTQDSGWVPSVSLPRLPHPNDFDPVSNLAKVRHFIDSLMDLVRDPGPGSMPETVKWAVHKLLLTRQYGKELIKEGPVSVKHEEEFNKRWVTLIFNGEHPELLISLAKGQEPLCLVKLPSNTKMESLLEHEIKLSQSRNIPVVTCSGSNPCREGILPCEEKESNSIQWDSGKSLSLKFGTSAERDLWHVELSRVTINRPIIIDKDHAAKTNNEARLFSDQLSEYLKIAKSREWFLNSNLDWKAYSPVEMYALARREAIRESNWVNWFELTIQVDALRASLGYMITQKVAKAAKHPDRILDLSFLGVDDKIVNKIASALVTSVGLEIRDVRLQCNTITGEGCRSLALLLARPNEKCKVRRLNLSGNPIGDKGAFILGSALRQNSSVGEIVLWSCGITEEGGQILLRAVSGPNTTVFHIDLEDNYVTKRTLEAIQKRTNLNLQAKSSLDRLFSFVRTDEHLGTVHSVSLLAGAFSHYFSRIINHPDNAKYRKIERRKVLKRTKEKKSSKGEQPPRCACFEKVLQACGFEYHQKKSFWALNKARSMYEPKLSKVLNAINILHRRVHAREESRVYSLFRRALVWEGAFLTKEVDRILVFDAIRSDPRIRRFYGFKGQFNASMFRKLFAFAVTSHATGCIKPDAYVSYATAFKHMLARFFKMFQSDAYRPKDQFYTLKKDLEIRKHFPGCRKMPKYDEFKGFFSYSTREKRGSIDIDTLVSKNIEAAVASGEGLEWNFGLHRFR